MSRISKLLLFSFFFCKDGSDRLMKRASYSCCNFLCIVLAAAYLKCHRCRSSCLPFVWHFFSLWHTSTRTHTHTHTHSHTHTHTHARAHIHTRACAKVHACEPPPPPPPHSPVQVSVFSLFEFLLHRIQRTLLWFSQLKVSRPRADLPGKKAYLPEDRPRPWNF